MFKRILFGFAGDQAGRDAAVLARGVEASKAVASVSARAFVER
jgi:hypothetical protein